MKISIRQAKIKDLVLITELTNYAYTIPYIPSGRITRANDNLDRIKDEIKEGAKIFVAEIKGKMIGSVRYKPHNNSLLLYKLAVSPTYRRQGVSKQLIQYVLQDMKTTEANQVIVEVAEEKGLIPYYKSLGFRIIKKYVNKGHHEVQMSRDITTVDNNQ